MVERIRAIRQHGQIPSILSLDVQKAFDNVSHERLLHDLRKRKVPTRLIEWIASFLSERSTSIRIIGYTSLAEKVLLGIPQGSPISPILYLFYNADLLDECKDIRLNTDPTGFVDDVNILTYSDSVARNSRNLEKAYEKCTEWAKTHGSKFHPEKSKLIHFIGRRRRGIPTTTTIASITLEGVTIDPLEAIKILGVTLNKDLTAATHFTTL